MLYINKDNLLMRKAIDGEPWTMDRICVPATLQEDLVKKIHQLETVHLRRDKTLDQVVRKYFFPGAHKIVEKVLKACEICFLKQPGQKPQKHTHCTVQYFFSVLFFIEY